MLRGQFVAELAQPRDVPVHAHQAERAARGIASGPCRAAQVVDAAVGPDGAELAVVVGATVDGILHGLHGAGAVLGVQQRGPVVRRHVVGLHRQPVQAEHALVPVHRAAHQVRLPHADAAAVIGQGDALVRGLQGLALQHAVGDVLHRPEQAHRALALELGAAHHPQPAGATRLRGQLHLDLPGPPLQHGPAVVQRDELAVLRQHVAGRLLGRDRVARRHTVQAAGLVRPVQLAGGNVVLPGPDGGQPADALEQAFALAQGLLLLAPLGDVARGAEHPLRATVGRAGLQLAAVGDPQPMPLDMAHPDLDLEMRALAPQVLHDGGLAARRVLGVDAGHPGLQVHAGEILRRMAQDVGPARVEAGLSGGQVPLPDAGAGGLDDRGQTLALLVQRLQGVFVSRDVVHRADMAGQRARRHVQPARHRAHPAHRATGLQHPEPHVEVRALGGRALPLVEHGFAVLGMHAPQPSERKGLRRVQSENLLPAPIGVAVQALGIGRKHAHRGRVAEGPQPALRQRRLLGQPAAFQALHHGAGQQLQGFDLGVVEHPRLPVQHAQGAHRLAVEQSQGDAGVKADAGLAGHQRAVRKPRVQPGIGHDQGLLLLDGPGAEAALARQLMGVVVHAQARHEADRLGLDEADQGHRRLAHQRRAAHQSLELRGVPGIQSVQFGQNLQPLRLALVRWFGFQGGDLSSQDCMARWGRSRESA